MVWEFTNTSYPAESDRVRTLDLRHDGHFADHFTVHRIGYEVRDNCRLSAPPALIFWMPHRILGTSCLRNPRTWSQAIASPRKLVNRAFRRLHSGNNAGPCLDEDGGAEGGHIVRHIPKHPLPRILPSSGLSEIWICGFMAHSRILRAGGCAVPLRPWDTAQEAVLGSNFRRTMADIDWPSTNRSGKTNSASI